MAAAQSNALGARVRPLVAQAGRELLVWSNISKIVIVDLEELAVMVFHHPCRISSRPPAGSPRTAAAVGQRLEISCNCGTARPPR